jgi:hypothetical protein
MEQFLTLRNRSLSRTGQWKSQPAEYLAETKGNQYKWSDVCVFVWVAGHYDRRLGLVNSCWESPQVDMLLEELLA